MIPKRTRTLRKSSRRGAPNVTETGAIRIRSRSRTLRFPSGALPDYVTKKGAALLLVFLVLGVPYATAQMTLSWDVEIEKPFYYIGEKFNGTITGPPNAFFQLLLINKSSGQRHLFLAQNVTPVGDRFFSIKLEDGWIPAGNYSLNLTVDRRTVAYVDVRIIYSEKYLHDREHIRIKDWQAADEENEKIQNKAIKDIALMWEMIMRILFVIMAILIFAIQVLIYFVVIPQFRAWNELSGRRGGERSRAIGLDANAKAFLEIKAPQLPDKTRANIKPAAQNLVDIGASEILAKSIIARESGDLGVMVSTKKDRKGENKEIKRIGNAMKKAWGKVQGDNLLIIGIFGAWPILAGLILLFGPFGAVGKVTLVLVVSVLLAIVYWWKK